MELKDYQADVLSDLSQYLETLLECKGHLLNAFTKFWKDRGVLNQAYKNNIKEVPHVCVKVPTAGGKTFIAVNALDRIFLPSQNTILPVLSSWCGWFLL